MQSIAFRYGEDHISFSGTVGKKVQSALVFLYQYIRHSSSLFSSLKLSANALTTFLHQRQMIANGMIETSRIEDGVSKNKETYDFAREEDVNGMNDNYFLDQDTENEIGQGDVDGDVDDEIDENEVFVGLVSDEENEF